MGDLRKTWQDAKAKTAAAIPSGFFGTADLGPLLDAFEAAEKKHEKLPGTASEKDQKKAYDAVKAALKAARDAVGIYVKKVTDAQKDPANKDNTAFQDALKVVLKVLTYDISNPLDTISKRFK